MSAYKQFNTQNLIVSPFEVNKGFLFIGGNALITPDVGIDRYLGANGGYLVSGSQLTGNIASQQIPKVLVYDSIKQLYYTNYLSGSRGFTQDAITSSILLGANREGDTIIGGIQQSNFYNYEQTTLWPNKDFPTSSLATSSVSVGVISIPSKLWGDYIQPNSFLLEGISGSIKDDGEGRLLWKLPSVGQNKYAYISGNIIYQHGIVTLFNPNKFGLDGEDFINSYITGNNVTMSFSSSYKLFETQYQVTINEDEFNYSLNPSSITGSEIPTKFSGSEIEWENTASIGKPLGFVTSSFFSPYITTVGLYNEDFELLAVGKLAQPLQSSQTTDTTILVNIDR